MQFEHLIAINDLQNPLVTALTREQIWVGLQHRIDNPVAFLPGLESSAIVERTESYLRRQLNFGAMVIEDTVTQAENHWVRFVIQPGEQHAGGSLTITIEEPQPGALFLRFAYTTSFAANPDSEDRAYTDYIKSAYHQSDLDCVRIIRTLAADGIAQ